MASDRVDRNRTAGNLRAVPGPNTIRMGNKAVDNPACGTMNRVARTQPLEPPPRTANLQQRRVQEQPPAPWLLNGTHRRPPVSKVLLLGPLLQIEIIPRQQVLKVPRLEQPRPTATHRNTEVHKESRRSGCG